MQGASVRAVLVPSVTRVLKKGNRKRVERWLAALDLTQLLRITTEGGFRDWFYPTTEALSHVMALRRRRGESPKGRGPDPRWGHAAKVLCLLVREAVLFRRCFGPVLARRMEPWLYVPIDREVIDRVKACGITAPDRIRRFDRQTFSDLQDRLAVAAKKVRARRIWFDDLRGELEFKRIPKR